MYYRWLKVVSKKSQQIIAYASILPFILPNICHEKLEEISSVTSMNYTDSSIFCYEAR